MSKKTFVKGAAILGIAGIIVKILGAVFRIPLGNMVSESSMAYYQPAYYIYTFFVVIATSGIPVAISRLVSEQATIGNYREAHRTFKISLYLMLTIGVGFFIVLFFWAEPLARLLHAPNARYPMMVIAPALIFVPLVAAFRGYFQGFQNMKPTAFSEVVEQVFRVVFGLLLAYFLFNSAKDVFDGASENIQTAADIKGAMGAVSGATIGSFAGLIFIMVIYAMSKKGFRHKMEHSKEKDHQRARTILKNILIIAVPITIGASVMPIMNMVEVPIINSRLLASGWTAEEADVLYGTFSGYIVSLINLPQVLTAAMAMSLVPLIASVYKIGDWEHLRHNTQLGLRVSMMIGLPAALGMAALSKPIILLLYPAKPLVADTAATSLTILAIGVVFLSIVQTLTAVLQGVGRQMVPVVNLAIAIVIKIILTYWLVAIPWLNIKGAAIATVVAYFVTAVLDIMATRKITKTHFDPLLCYVKPLISAVIMAVVAWSGYHLGIHLLGSGLKTSALLTLIVIVLSGMIYFILLVLTKSIVREDLENLPKGGKLIGLYDRISRTK